MITVSKLDRGKLNVLIDAMALSILPPMYFFAHIYYTDIPSITMILFTLFYSMKEKFLISSLFGLFSVIMRQTNIVWMAGIFGSHLVDLMVSRVYKKLKLEETTLSQLIHAAIFHLKSPAMLFQFIYEAIRKFYGYIMIVLAFIAFLYVNGSIVGEFERLMRIKIIFKMYFFFQLEIKQLMKSQFTFHNFCTFAYLH